MCRLLATVVVASLVCGMTAAAARAECRRTVVSCESSCVDLQNDTMASCSQRCRSFIICEAEPKRSAKSRLPGGELPSGRLPGNRLPVSHLPDSFLD